MSSKHHITRNAYVVYCRGRGYMKNKAGEFHEDFAHARLYPTEKAAAASIDMNKKLKQKVLQKDDLAIVIPVEMTLDPKQIFKTILNTE